jgi:hypothetical protein
MTFVLPGAYAADMSKTLRGVFNIAETSFDPAAAWDAPWRCLASGV